ncbi:MAG: B12-binding domain-containing radical SAM protein, partial [Magnetococcus sp. YQC-9]
MKVVVINPVNPGRGRNSYRPPYGLLCVSSVLLKRNVDVVWIDADVMRDHDRVMQLIGEHPDADLLATGGMHSSYPYIKQLFTDLVARHNNIPTILGGRIASTIKHILWEKIPGINMLCEQEGEPVMDALINHLPNWENTPGIQYKKDGKLITNPPAPTIPALERKPNFPWHFLSDIYFPKQVGFLLTGRGCPFKCHFCRIEDQPTEKYRAIDMDETIKDVRYMVEQRKVKKIIIIDELFIHKKARIVEFCQKIKEFNIEWSCTARGDTLTDGDLPMLQAMREAGCTELNMGLETGSPEMLMRMNKKLNLERAERSIQLVRQAGMEIKASFIFAYPGETRKTALESIRWRKKMNLPGGYFYAAPYPGSELYNMWIEENNYSLEMEEQLLVQSLNLNRFSVNMTDMPDWRVKLLSAECLFRLNSMKYN